MLSEEEIESRFSYHKARTEGIRPSALVHQRTREVYKELAMWLNEELPDGRAKAMAFTYLEQAAMWSNKAIAESDPVVKD